MLDFLAERLPAVARADWRLRMARGEVLDEQARPVDPGQPFRHGVRLYYYRHLTAEPDVPFEAPVLHQDAWLVVVDKPHFLPVIPTGRYVQQSLLVRLKRQLGIDSLVPIHRIDRETAGLVVFAVQPETRNAYQALFRDRMIYKAYEAIAPWHADDALPPIRRSRLVEDEAFFRMREVEGPPNSETRMAVLEVRGALARYRLEPLSGKRHQLRVHMNALGRPIVDDAFYPVVRQGPGAPDDFARPLRLLARAIAFTDPVTGEPRRFESRRTLDWPEPGCPPA